MANIKAQIELEKKAFEESLNKAKSKEELEEIRVKFLGRQGSISALMHNLKDLSIEEKRETGSLLNNLKAYAQEIFTKKLENISHNTDNKTQKNSNISQFDVTSYLPNQPKGSLHPYTLLINELEPLFISMGFEMVEGPEVENQYNNFEALNIPPEHPARDMQDTFWLTLPGLLMRTQTSAVQAQELQKRKPPLALASIGRCYRNEATDASHDVMFMQLEGLVVDKNISLAQLLSTTKYIFQSIFKNKKIETRIRSSYFPFVEPGIEIDISCPFCTQGCSACKKSGWLEAGGAGLVHPNVLNFCGIDSKKYSGFAFGFGLTRLVMLKFGITDIRLLHSNKIDFLEQF